MALIPGYKVRSKNNSLYRVHRTSVCWMRYIPGHVKTLSKIGVVLEPHVKYNNLSITEKMFPGRIPLPTGIRLQKQYHSSMSDHGTILNGKNSMVIGEPRKISRLGMTFEILTCHTYKGPCELSKSTEFIGKLRHIELVR